MMMPLIWMADLDSLGSNVDRSSLSDEELGRARRFRSALHGRRYATAHAWLRTQLALLVDIRPAELVFGAAPCCHCDGDHGKPVIAGAGEELHFSFSRSGPAAAIAVASTPIGIDIEVSRPRQDVGALAERFFSAEEAQYLTTLDREGAAAAFLRLWTRKEAILKATGEGVLGALDTPVLREPEATSPDEGLLMAGWWVTDLDLGRAVTGAVASADGSRPEFRGDGVRRLEGRSGAVVPV